MENIIKLEERYKAFTGRKYAVTCSSGTAALHLSLAALRIGEGDEVIIPDFTMGACGFAVAYTGARVITVDCGKDFNLDVSKIEEKITSRTRAIMPVDIYGRVCDMESVRYLANIYGLSVIEDGCEAHGATDGEFADAVCFSFYKNKIIHAEEGGIICTDSRLIWHQASDLKNMAFGKRHDYFHERIGFNYRMPDSQAKMVLESMDSYESNVEKRRKFESDWQKIKKTPKRDAVWVYDFLCDTAKDKADKIKELDDKKIGWRHFFKPLSTMPPFHQTPGKNALDFSNRGLYIQYHEY